MITELGGRVTMMGLSSRRGLRIPKKKHPHHGEGSEKASQQTGRPTCTLNLPIKEYSEAFNPEHLCIQYYYKLYTIPYTMRKSPLGLCRCSGSEDWGKKSIELFSPSLFSKGEKILRKLLMCFAFLSGAFFLLFYPINTFGDNSKIFGVYKNIVPGWTYFAYYGQFLLTSCLLLN